MKEPFPAPKDELRIRVQDTKESFKRTYVADGPDPVLGRFTFILDITALLGDLYIPLSVASGKKPTGFIYQIEGTVPGSLSTTDISAKGDGILQITLGTIVYCHIPAGK